MKALYNGSDEASDSHLAKPERTKSWRNEDVADILTKLDASSDQGSSVLHFTFLVLAIDNTKELANLARNNCRNLISDPDLGRHVTSARDHLFRNTEISGYAIEHCMEANSFEAMKYLCSNCDLMYVTPAVRYSFVSQMSTDYARTKRMINIMLKHKIQMKGLDRMEADFFITGNPRHSENKSAESVSLNQFSRKPDESAAEASDSGEEEKVHDSNNSGMIRKPTQRHTPRNSGQLMPTNIRDLPSPQTTGCVYLEIEVILETIFRSKSFSVMEEFGILTDFFEDFTELKPTNKVMLVRLLITYQKIELIHKILEIFEGMNKRQAKNFGYSGLVSMNLTTITKALETPEGVIRSFILELVFSIIDYGNMFFLEDILMTFRSLIENNTIPIINRIALSIERKYQNSEAIPYAENYFTTILTLCEIGVADMKTIQDLMSVMSKLLKEDPKINFMANCYNPIKIFIDIARMLDRIDQIFHNFTEEVKNLTSEFEEVVIRIIDERQSSDHLRNWLYEDYNSSFKVIDYIAHFEFLNILNHPKMIKTVEQMWMGKYDLNSFSAADRNYFLPFSNETRSPHYGIDGEESLAIFRPGHWFGFYKYPLWSCGIKIKQLVDESKVNESGSEKILMKGPRWGFAFFKDSMYFHYNVAFIIDLMIGLIAAIVFGIMVFEQSNMVNTYSSSINGQTNNTTIENGYTVLLGQGNRWRDSIVLFISLSVLFNSNFTQDILVLISYAIRGIGMGNLSTVYKWIICVDFVAACASYALYIEFAPIYSEDRTNVRVEERNYQMMLELREGNIDPSSLMVLIILCISARILLNLVYNTVFGSFVQIVFRMGKDSFIFLCIYVIVIVIFALIGTALFYDVDQFSNFIEAFIHLYESALGGFDFDIFDGSKITDPQVGKAFIAIYLLISAILLLNFLIAIMSETYSRLKDYSIGMKMAQVIKIRPIYEDHPYYSCIVKSLPVFNFIVLSILPFIICCKSRRLNNVILRIEFLTFQFFMKLLLLLIGFICIPFIALYLLTEKLRSIFSPNAKHCNRVWALIDFIILIPIAIYNAFYIVFYWIVVSTLHENLSKNILKVTEIFKEDFISINKMCDKSYGEEEDDDNQIDLYFFKKSLGTELKIEYNPSNMMLAETTVNLLVAVLKESEVHAKELGKGYIPTAYLVKNLRKYMFVDSILASLIFQTKSLKDNISESKDFFSLIDLLADRSIGGINNKDLPAEYPDYIEEDGENLILKNALIGSHAQRKEFWKQRMNKFFNQSNKQWLLDQFKYSKLFLEANSYPESPGKIPKTVMKLGPYIYQLISRAKKLKTMYMTGERWNDINADHGGNKSKSETKISILNVPALLNEICSFEKFCRSTCLYESKNGEKVIHKETKVYKKLATKNTQVFKQFISSNFSTNYRAVESK